MANTVLIGSQWGDEGKGKIIDVLTSQVDWVVRYQGGNNAGHTVIIGDEKYVLHLIPSGILHEGRKCVIGNGMVVDIIALMDELKAVESRNISAEGRLFVSDRAHVILPTHRAIDAAREAVRSDDDRIGTTKRGIGPCYEDKAKRCGMRICDFMQDGFEDKLRERVSAANKELAMLGAEPVDADEVVNDCRAAVDYLKSYFADTIPLLHEATVKGESILLEGAQGNMLDIDHGTYPFVTSSNASAGGATTGCGMPPHKIDCVLGVIKAYTTRVGEGPFPTELLDDVGEALRARGGEFGATTGRPRRCGWFDAVVAKQAVMVNGVTFWALTKLDVLDDFDTLLICTSYECDGRQVESIPACIDELARCKPVYEEMPGWKCSTSGAASFDELPDNAKAYIKRLEEITGVPVGILSVGPKRSSTMIIDEFFKA
jgi:adenylosuccinate synthase